MRVLVTGHEGFIEGWQYRRLAQVKRLQAEGRVDGALRWRP